MVGFKEKVEELRRFESLCYTICVTLLKEEREACAAAERTLSWIFADPAFWAAEEAAKPRYVMRICMRVISERGKTGLANNVPSLQLRAK
ncbi:hypothetical protein [Paenibacillus arenilitoris]|uniref:Uncharacterized protein n=1 Tax=Paenibacillus arenilitoris TaxID=2772299 RepID=A0A927CP73_9BACL|nr:hypothetical protein [Paenibacillus arenilitoris]MBD2871164.1 hypothetical protein [Paenibacillus arenilitoris]